MRSVIVSFLVLSAVAVSAGAVSVDYSPLWKVPDLSPQLTAEEVSKVFTPWVDRAKEITAQFKPSQAVEHAGARSALGPKLPKVTSITLYSLYPMGLELVRQLEPKRVAELEKLPRYHEFPILGQLTIDDAAQANRWVGFLRDQIIPGGFSSCDFLPRHGFRLSAADGDTDIVVCYQCSQLGFKGSTELDIKHNPVFSPATRDQLNLLFDKLKIKRDDPEKKPE